MNFQPVSKQHMSAASAVILMLAGGVSMAYEEPRYSVVPADAGIEYRQYEPYLVSETVIENRGDYKRAGDEGFKRLFRYITGANEVQADITMTTPVAQSESTKIDMTAPVQQSGARDSWTVSFMLPAEYTLETAPVPTDPRVYVRAVPGRLMAVQRFAGRWTDKNFARREASLRQALAERGVEPVGDFERAVYNAPFSLPFFRRNEVMVAVAAVPESVAALDEQQLAAY